MPSRLKIALLIYLLLILIISLLPINPSNSPINNTYLLSIRLDYLFHFLIFIPMMFLLTIAYSINYKTNIKKALTWLLLSLLFSWFSEAVQLFVPYRAFNLNDILSNSIGVLLGSLFFALPPSLHTKLSAFLSF